jgi:hypothetical protein
MLDDAFAGTERKVQPAMARVALLKALDDPQCMKIVIKSHAVMPEALIQRTLAGMPERRMANVMYKGKRLSQINIEIECRSDVPSDLRHLHGMRQTAAEMIRCAAGEHLRLTCETAERARLNYTVAVALKRRPIVAGRGNELTLRERVFLFAKDTQGMQIVNHRCSVA